MRLYLSSYRLGSEPGALIGRRSRDPKIAILQNAQDHLADASKRRSVFERECADLRALGFEPVELDLRTYFGRAEILRQEFAHFNHCWACGGNSFVLRRAFHLSGFDDILLERADYDDEFTYGGYSAGACVVTPTLEGIHLADEPAADPAGYSGPVLWDGLGLYPFCVAPHFRSDHPESKLIEQSVEFFITNKLPFVALRDGEAIIFDTKSKEGRVVGGHV